MDQEERELLNNTFSLVKENNKMLHKIRSSQKWASFMRIVYWLIIIGISIGAFYYLQPYITQMQNIIQKTGVSLDQLKGLGNLPR